MHKKGKLLEKLKFRWENTTIQNREGEKDPESLAKTDDEKASQMVVAEMETNGDQISRSYPQHDEQNN